MKTEQQIKDRIKSIKKEIEQLEKEEEFRRVDNTRGKEIREQFIWELEWVLN